MQGTVSSSVLSYSNVPIHPTCFLHLRLKAWWSPQQGKPSVLWGNSCEEFVILTNTAFGNILAALQCIWQSAMRSIAWNTKVFYLLKKKGQQSLWSEPQRTLTIAVSSEFIRRTYRFHAMAEIAGNPIENAVLPPIVHPVVDLREVKSCKGNSNNPLFTSCM